MVSDVPLKKSPSADWYYHHPEYRYNCAQAIVTHYNCPQTEIDNMRAMGSGKAPKGYCGALYGAIHLLAEKPEAIEAFIDKFAQKTGSPYCRQIRKKRQVNCRQCVQIADKNLKDIFYPIS